MSDIGVHQLIRQLESRGIALWLDGEKIRYSAAKGCLTPALLDDIRRYKTQLIETLSDRQQSAESSLQPIAAQSNHSRLLSFGQERLWFLNQYQAGNLEGSIAYNMCGAIHMRGKLNADALQKAFDAIVQRHHILHSRFANIQGKPEVVLCETICCPFERIDLSPLTEEQQRIEFEKLAHAEATQPFDIASDPLIRVKLFHFSNQHHQLVINLHHMVADGWSIGVLIKELNQFYKAYCTGADPAIPTLAVQYSDYVHWQRQAGYLQRLENQLSYWESTLADMPQLLTIAQDRVRPTYQGFRGAKQQIRIDKKLTSALQALAGERSSTLFNVLLSSFGVLLSRYSMASDIPIGTAVANRPRPELESLIGLFINTVVMRLQLEDDPSFIRLLDKVKKLSLQAFAHQELPFEHIVNALKADRDLSHTPLFQVMFIMQNSPIGELRLPGLKVDWQEVETHTAKFDLTLSLEEKNDCIVGWLEYNTDLFSQGFIQNFTDNFQVLLQQIIDNPQQKVSCYDCLSDKQQQQIFQKFNQNDKEHDRSLLIQTGIDEQAQLKPDATALVFEDREMSFQRLHLMSDTLAKQLIKQGVNDGDIVALALPRSPELLVAMLAVLKTGAAYLPIDISQQPENRVTYILQDAKAKCLLCSQKNVSDFSFLDSSQTILVVESLLSETPSASVTLPVVKPENVAYVIYTSGSTGQPKGVQVTHANVINFFIAMDDEVPLNSSSVLLAVTTVAFDIAVLELLWTLHRGVKVVIQNEISSYFSSGQRQQVQRKNALEFGLFYFSSNHNGTRDANYTLLMEGAKFADSNGFSSVWTPERHFHAFGGIYPNPAVTSAAIAAVTKNVAIRAGSVVAPLHNPLRIAEEWAVVDNLSGGRAAVSFASGWQADDFVLQPEHYQDRKNYLYDSIAQVQALWRGEKIPMLNGHGKLVPTEIFPKPLQENIPIWFTAAGSPETFQKAGECGANLLTHLIGQSLDELAEKISLYRTARKEAGYNPETGIVSLMIHTFVGEDTAQVRELVRQPMCDYLASSFDLLSKLASSMGMVLNQEDLSDEDFKSLLNHAFERYFEENGLFGSVQDCVAKATHIHSLGIDEIAALIDFGVEQDLVLEALPRLLEVKQEVTRIQEQQVDEFAPMSIADNITRHGVSHLQCTPSLAKMLLSDVETREALSHLTNLCVGGEALSPALGQELCEQLSANIFNMYGPTETTIWSCVEDVRQHKDDITIGRPIANTQVYILDNQLQLQAIGAQGEICIGGEGVVKGYWLRDDLNAERFVELDISGQKQRLYRTGDLGCFIEDGRIRFLGRRDNQIKIRGYRIEIGEIEAALLQCENVREAAVILVSEKDDHKLVMYVVPSADQASSFEEYRLALSERVPTYMLPSQLVVLSQLPQTPNGKIDRQALPKPSSNAAVQDKSAFVAPRTALELQLTLLWEKVLDVHPVGVTDNFFDIGGHSLLAVSLLAQVDTQFSRRIPIASMFQGPTVEQMAKLIQQEQSQSSSPIVLIQNGRSSKPLFLVPGAGGQPLYYHNLVSHFDSDLTVYGFQSLQVGAVFESEDLVEQMAQHYCRELLKVQSEGPYYLAGHSFGGHVVYEMARILQSQGKELAFLGVIDTPAPIKVTEMLSKDWDLAQWICAMAGVFRRLHSVDLGLDAELLRAQPEQRQVELFMAELKQRNLLAPDMDIEAMGGFIKIFKADQQSIYAPAKDYKGAIHVFKAETFIDASAVSEELIPVYQDAALGWQDFTQSQVHTHCIPGDHLSIVTEPYVQYLAEKFQSSMTEEAKRFNAVSSEVVG